MSLILIIGIITVLCAVVKYAYWTETPKIIGLPEIPGLPFFGSLLELGNCHARKAAEWSRKYGPVFQVRLGSKVI
jgi:phenylacetate 2-hydroxylase